VNSSLDPRDYTIKTAIERMEQLGHDPVAQVLQDNPDLGDVLKRLAAQLAG
jgi:hypothetical protein